MYLPPAFEETRLDVLHELMRAYPLATLVTQGALGLEVNLLPLLLDTPAGLPGMLRGHLARSDQQENAEQQEDSETQAGDDDTSTEEQMGASAEQMEAGETEDIDGEEANVSVDQDADLDADDSPDEVE